MNITQGSPTRKRGLIPELYIADIGLHWPRGAHRAAAVNSASGDHRSTGEGKPSSKIRNPQAGVKVFSGANCLVIDLRWNSI
jgi:hypothetical protein